MTDLEAPLIGKVSVSNTPDISTYIKQMQSLSAWQQYRQAAAQERDLILLDHAISRITTWLPVLQQERLNPKKTFWMFEREISRIEMSVPLSDMLATSLMHGLNVGALDHGLSKDALEEQCVALGLAQDSFDAWNPDAGVEEIRKILTKLKGWEAVKRKLRSKRGDQTDEDVVRFVWANYTRLQSYEVQFLPLMLHFMDEDEYEKVNLELLPDFLARLQVLRATMMTQQTFVKGVQSKVLAGMVTAGFGLVQVLVKAIFDNKSHD